MSLTASIEELVSPQFVDHLAVQTGLPKEKVRTGVTGAIASILDRIAGKAGDARAMSEVATVVRTAPQEDVEHLLDDETTLQRETSQLLGAVGGDAKSMTARLGRYIGVGGKAAAGLFGAASAAVVGGFRKLGAADPNTLAKTLAQEHRSIHAAVPANLLNGDATRAALDAPRGSILPRRRPWLVPLLLLTAAIIALWMLGRMRMKHTARAPNVTAPTAPAPRPTPSPSSLAFPPGSGEEQLVDELRGPKTLKPRWIELDVQFDTGAATLRPDAKNHLANVAKILAAFPSARVRVGGYNDTTGTAEANAALSQARANAVRDALVSDGVDPARVESTPNDGQADGGDEPVEAHHATIEVIEH